MKLELKHLAPYMPYGIEAVWLEEQEIVDLTGTCLFDNKRHYELKFKEGIKGLYRLEDFKPILRPLSDLKKLIDNDETNVTYSAFLKLFVEADLEYVKSMPLSLDYHTVSQLLQWHFDVFGLIDAGLAIDINTLNN